MQSSDWNSSWVGYGPASQGRQCLRPPQAIGDAWLPLPSLPLRHAPGKPTIRGLSPDTEWYPDTL